MQSIRKKFSEIKEGFLSGKIDSIFEACYLANVFFLSIVYMFCIFVSNLIGKFYSDTVELIIFATFTALFLTIRFDEKAFFKIFPISSKILFHFFGRYGLVVTKQDWKNIKKLCPKGYKEIWSKKAIGHCYLYSWAVALYLDDAELMYCSIRGEDGLLTGHSVIVKNNCVYCTNSRHHFDLEEYKEMLDVKVYRMFSAKEYRNNHFLDDIRDGFVNWCKENGVYCNPQY